MEPIKPISCIVVVALVTVLFAGLATARAAEQCNTLGQAVDNQKLLWWTNGTAEHYSRTFTGTPEWTEWTQNTVLLGSSKTQRGIMEGVQQRVLSQMTKRV